MRSLQRCRSLPAAHRRVPSSGSGRAQSGFRSASMVRNVAHSACAPPRSSARVPPPDAQQATSRRPRRGRASLCVDRADTASARETKAIVGNATSVSSMWGTCCSAQADFSLAPIAAPVEPQRPLALNVRVKGSTRCALRSEQK